MSLSAPECPVCAGALILTHRGTFDSWVCPQAHGLAVTLSEAYERLQEDELATLWSLARAASPGPAARRSPTTGRPMVAVEVPYDADEAAEGEAGDGPAAGSVWVDVDPEDQVIWFDAGELEQFPADLADPEPSPAELAAEESIRVAFGEQVAAAAADRGAGRLTERIYRRVARHAGLARALTEVGSLGRR